MSATGAGSSRPRRLALTQGDPAGVGPEIVLRLLGWPRAGWEPVLVAERAALAAYRGLLPPRLWDRLRFVAAPAAPADLEPEGDTILVIDPVGSDRRVVPGASGAADARGALAALDAGLALAREGLVDALITGPVSKGSIARHCVSGFTGQTEYLAAACGCERYGRDYLMAFLAPGLQVALLSTHLPLRIAIETVDREGIVNALGCLARHAGGRIAVAGLNPHAGEGGLLGREDLEVVAPAVAAARAAGIDAHGPESADSLFARARRGEFDWVLALYHDQGLVAIKTAAFGSATNWTLGLPVLRTSVDHGTAFALAGRGEADVAPLRAVVETTLELLNGNLPRPRRSAGEAPAPAAPAARRTPKATKRRGLTARPESSSPGS